MHERYIMKRLFNKELSKSYFFILFIVFSLIGCSSHTALMHKEGRLGVVKFYQPTALNELFAGKLIPYNTKATTEEIEKLTQTLLADIKKNTSYTIEYISNPSPQGKEETPLAYWTTIGKEKGVDLLIVAQIMEWKEGEYIRERYIPPKVVIEYYLIDVENKKLLERSRYYDEYMNTEYDLRYNTPANGMFFNRRPSCMELAVDSIHKMLIDFSFVRNRKERNILAQ